MTDSVVELVDKGFSIAQLWALVKCPRMYIRNTDGK